jgi:hypothetical protein
MFRSSCAFSRRLFASRRWSNSGLLLHRHRNVAVRRQTDLVAFHVGHETAVDATIRGQIPSKQVFPSRESDASALVL